MINVVVNGCLGRMGKMVANSVRGNSGLNIVAGLESKEAIAKITDLNEILDRKDSTPIPIYDSIESVSSGKVVIIDFTFPKVTLSLLEKCVQRGENFAVVTGTTGFNDEELEQLKLYSKSIPIVFGYNMSLGVNLLAKVVEVVASKLPISYDVEIVESHHKHKKDSPSGTAIKLGNSVAIGRGIKKLSDVAIYGRKGLDLSRPEGEIGIHAIRGGDIVGEHDVAFIADGERIVLSHKAHSRMAFVKGAVEATFFVSDKPAGLYTMGDVLGFN